MKYKIITNTSVALIVSISILTFILSLVFSDHIYQILPSGFILIGLTLLYEYRQNSHLDDAYFVVMALTVLTVCLSIIFLDQVLIILPIGILSIALALNYAFLRQSSSDPIYYLLISLGMLLLGTAYLLVDFSDAMFSTGLFTLVIVSWILTYRSNHKEGNGIRINHLSMNLR